MRQESIRTAGCRRAAPLLLAAALALPVGCGTKVSDYRCLVGADDAIVGAAEIWDCNRRIIKRAIRGKGFSMRELDHAATFFETLTELPADLELSDLGPLPGARLRDSLAAWDAWYERNGDRLRWDDASRRVVVGPV